MHCGKANTQGSRWVVKAVGSEIYSNSFLWLINVCLYTALLLVTCVFALSIKSPTVNFTGALWNLFISKTIKLQVILPHPNVSTSHAYTASSSLGFVVGSQASVSVGDSWTGGLLKPHPSIPPLPPSGPRRLPTLNFACCSHKTKLVSLQLLTEMQLNQQ